MEEKKCDQCGNHYEDSRTLKITYLGKTYNFDSFECAVHQLAPKCQNCGIQILGHGISKGNEFFCCDNCSTR